MDPKVLSFLVFVGCAIVASAGFLCLSFVDESAAEEDICGFCGEPGADKIPHPVHWPGEQSVDTEFVHAECEQEECGRAHAALSDREREEFLRTV